MYGNFHSLNSMLICAKNLRELTEVHVKRTLRID